MVQSLHDSMYRVQSGVRRIDEPGYSTHVKNRLERLSVTQVLRAGAARAKVISF